MEHVEVDEAGGGSRPAAVARRLGSVGQAIGAARRGDLGAISWLRLSVEVTIGTIAALSYFAVRSLTEGSRDAAIENARDVVDLSRTLGIFWEPEWQEAIVDHGWLVDLWNWVYIYGHWPLIGTVAVLTILYRPASYTLYRNAFLLSGAIGLVVFATFPVAPPRLMSELAVVDTVTEKSEAYRVLQPPAFTNQYAAMPSLHFGWNLLVGFALAKGAPYRALRLVGVVTPIMMFFAVILTANHFILDALAGGLVAMVGLLAAIRLRAILSRWNDRVPIGGLW